MLEDWTQELFEENLNTRYEIESEDGGRQNLELISVTRLANGPAVKAFSAIFRGTADRPLGQGTYLTRHARMGEAPLFLVPVGREADGMRYEAVFNRLVKS
jgi:hypothetical protein